VFHGATGALALACAAMLRRPAPAAAPGLNGEDVGAVLDHFFDAAPVGLLLIDDEQRVLRVNHAAVQAARRETEQHVGLRFDQIPRMPQEAIDAVRAVAQTHEPRRDVAIQRETPDGAVHHIRASYFPIRLSSGRWLVGSVLQDVSYQHTVEQQRQEALAAAQEANRTKDQFLAKVSHELRSPLQIALSSTEVLRRVPGMPPDARKFIDRLGHSIAMQARMINDLLDVSRILSGKLHVANEPMDPAQPMLRIADHWTQQAAQRGIRLELQGLEPDSAVVQADPERLEQVYANLLDNAIRFSRDGGVVQVGAHAGRAHWRFFVRDFGAGMVQEDIGRVFEPFAQGAAQPKGGKGLGLGLAIVRSLVDAFGGRVWAESAGPDAGCTFLVELPLLVPDSTPPSGFGGLDAPTPAPRLEGLQLLYVEDEEEVALAMQAGLQRLGAEVALATTRDAAVSLLARLQRLDAVVTDLNLGEGGTGHEVAQALRDMPRHAMVPVLAVSAFGSAEDVAATREAGFADHLVKPVGVSAVARAVRRALGI
jgi:PAS domain S-box-containing protein